jgi:hypothetical protein
MNNKAHSISSTPFAGVPFGRTNAVQPIFSVRYDRDEGCIDAGVRHHRTQRQ